MSETKCVETSPVERIVIRFSPKVGDEFMARPQLAYDLPIKVLKICGDGILVETKKGVTMMIPIIDWNKYVSNKIIISASV